MKKTVLAVVLTLILTGMLILVFDTKPISALSGITYIQADGSINPPTAPISTADNITYTLTANITCSDTGIIVQRSNIVVDGAGYTLHCFYGPSAYGHGIGLRYTTNVRVQNIQINNFYLGIWLYTSPDNNITGNNITDNRFGIIVSFSSGNRFYHNNFIDNTDQVAIDDGVNIWDDGYPSGGNYWSDYTGADSYNGPYQNEPGADGIGDALYYIDANNRDNYPLMEPYGGHHNIGMAYCATSKTGCLPVPTVGQGNTIDVNITAVNQGDPIETFNITAYANATTIATFENVTLNGGNSMTLCFVWNTTGFLRGNCTLLFSAGPVQNETDTLDNTLLGWIIITVPGDVNGDGTVNIADSIYVANSFLAKPDDADWISNADVNCDNVVNILDSITIGLNFLQPNP